MVDEATVEKMTIIGPVKLTNKQLAAILLVLAILPVFYPLGLPLLASQFTKDFYTAVENLKPGDVTAWAGLFSLRRYVQNKDAVRAVLRHMARLYPKPNNIKMIFYNFFTEGPTATQLAVKHSNIEADFGYVYGVDYVIFPYIAGEETALAAVADNMRLFATDMYGTPISQLQLMNGINVITDCQLGVMPPYEVLTFGEEVTRQWGTRGLYLIDGSNYASIAPYYGTYVLGALDADRGMAEYEVMTGYPGAEAAKMDIRNAMGIPIILLTVLAAINGLMTEKKEKG